MDVEGYEYRLAPAGNYKLIAVVPYIDPMTMRPAIREVPFGDRRYEHYYDRTGLLPDHLNHGDPKRRRNYLRRSAKIRDKNGRLTARDPLSANYHSRRVLW